MVELDFSLSSTRQRRSPPSQARPNLASKPAPPKRDELFIPELEEMLVPLTEEPKTPARPRPRKNSRERTIFSLISAKEPRPAPAKPDIAELDLLDFDTKK